MPIPQLTYNEERPQFIGKDVQGIKELNQVLAQKYDINKQATIQTEDLLDSMKTLDVDQNILSEASQGFQSELQAVADNNDYERAGQIVEKAVTGIKRNKALKQSVSNYAGYQEYSNALKDDPRGWTEEEISNIRAYSLDRYNGVRVDETGEAVGTFQGYDPGEKINVLTEFDEGLKDFAVNKGFEVSAVRNVLENGTKKGFTTTTTEGINKTDIIEYLKRYYKNDPKLNKYYETKAVIDSRKPGEVVSNELLNNIQSLNINSTTDPVYADFLKTLGVTDGTDMSLDFIEWQLNRNSNTDMDLRSLMTIASSGEEGSQEAKGILSSINSQLNRNLDFEAAALKNSFMKSDIKHNLFNDDMLLYKLKQSYDNSKYLYTTTGTAQIFSGDKYIGKKGDKILSSEIANVRNSMQSVDDMIEANKKKALADGDWSEEEGFVSGSPYEINNNRLVADNYSYQQELDNKLSYSKSATDYAVDQIGGTEEIESTFNNLEQHYRDKIKEVNIQLYGDKTIPFDANNPKEELNRRDERELKENLDYYQNELNDLNEKGYSVYSNEFKVGRRPGKLNDFSAYEAVQSYKDRQDNIDGYKNEYFKNNNIATQIPTIVHVDENASEQLLRDMQFVSTQFAENNAAFVIRDADGRPIEDVNARPTDGRFTGMSVDRFSDGHFYYEMIAQTIDEKGVATDARYPNRKGGGPKKYYVRSADPSMNQRFGSLLLDNENPKVVQFGYTLLQPMNYRFNTQDITVANTDVPITSNTGLKMGTVKMFSSVDKDGVSNYKTTRVEYNVPEDIITKYNSLIGDVDEKLVPRYLFDNKFKFEATLNQINDIINKN